MITYNYKCNNKECNHEWEQKQKISEDKIKACPNCKQETAERLITTGNFILNGGGWYKTSGKY